MANRSTISHPAGSPKVLGDKSQKIFVREVSQGVRGRCLPPSSIGRTGAVQNGTLRRRTVTATNVQAALRRWDRCVNDSHSDSCGRPKNCVSSAALLDRLDALSSQPASDY